MFSYVMLEQRVPQDHSLREIRCLTDVVLRLLRGEFDSLYSASGRPSIAPEYVLRALLLQAFYPCTAPKRHHDPQPQSNISRSNQISTTQSTNSN